MSARVSNRNQLDIPRQFRNWFRNCIHEIRKLCGCAKENNEENFVPVVHAVDSVRLVYMRRIEEVSQRQSQIDESPQGDIPLKVVQKRRTRKKPETLEALERALKEYEEKNKTIISSTAIPESFVHNSKENKITRSSQTDANRKSEEEEAVMPQVQEFESRVEIEQKVVHYSNCEEKCANIETNKSNDASAE